MEAYPLMLNIKGKQAVVIGGGKIAYRKINRLLRSGAQVTVISPSVNVEIKQLVKRGKIDWDQREFESNDVLHALIVIAATNDQQLNRFISQITSPTQLVNVVNDPEAGNFHVPASFSRGDLSIAIATNGASPTLARHIRDELALIYDDSYEPYVEFLQQARKKIQQSETLEASEKKELLTKVASESYRNDQAKQRLLLDSI